jgi:autotransporter-associated beta strand protein
MTLNGGSIKFSGGGTRSALISGAGSLIKAGNNTLNLSGDNTYTGVTTISNGTLSAFTLANGGVNSPIGAATSDATNLVFAGGILACTATTSSDRNFTIVGTNTATINVPAATSNLTLTGTAPATSGYLKKIGNGTLTLDPGAGSYTVGCLSADGGSLILKSGTFTTTGLDPFNPAYQVGAGARGGDLVVDGATLNVTGGPNAALKPGTSTVNGNIDILSGSVTAGSYILGHNASVLATQSGGSVSVTNLYHQDSGTATNTMTGGMLTVRRIFNNNATTNTSFYFTLILNGGVVQAAAGTANLMDNGGGGSELTVQLGTNGATIDTSLSSAAIVRPLDDVPGQAGQLTKIGANTLTLSSNNTYTGSTTVSNGTLVLNATNYTPLVTVQSGATLGGNGFLRTVSVAAGGILSPGASVGKLSLTNLTLAATATNVFEFDAAAGTNDTVDVLDLTAGSSVVQVSITNGTLAAGSYRLFNYGTKSGSFSPAVVLGGGSYLGHGLGLDESVANQVNLVVSNAVPVANTNTYSRGGLDGWKILVSDLLTNATDADGDTLTLASVGTSTNGITLYNDGTYVHYTNVNLVDDAFSYTVTDGFGGTNTAVITLLVGSGATGTSSIGSIVYGNPTTLTAFGVATYTYITERATNINQVVWDAIATNIGPSISVTDSNPPSPSAFYRIKWQQP